MRQHIKSPGEAPGVYPLAVRGRELKFLSFTIVELGGSFREYGFESGAEELALDFYTGPVRVEIEGDRTVEILARHTIAEAGPMIYVPAGSKVKLAALHSAARITLTGALGKPGVPAVVVGPEQAARKVVGKDNWTRVVYSHIATNVDAARLIAGETINQPGGWSSCPPHKHDRFAASEVPMEEVYYFQFEPRQGFGFLRCYTDPDDPEPFDRSYAVEHGDTVLVSRGYHPVVACPGYTLNYTWVLAGEGRTYGAWSDDPRHAWIKS
jgi:5-deoxy-glucuronate isomerase